MRRLPIIVSLALIAAGVLLYCSLPGCSSQQEARRCYPARNQLVAPMQPVAHASADELDVSAPSPLVIRSEVRTRFVPRGEK